MIEGNTPRRVVPRWRSSWHTATTPEARAILSGLSEDFASALARAEAEFTAAPSIPIAAELMFVATQANNENLALVAADAILKQKEQISSTSLLAAARRVRDGDGGRGFEGSRNDFVRTARKVLNKDFNNPVLLTDVALALTASGNAKSAERYIRSALHLAPANRFITRSAVRYFLHIGDREQAHKLLLRSVLLGGDPWIQASEIAVASVLGKTSKLAKSAENQLSAQPILPIALSELGSAVATVHLNAGSDKKAKRLFAKTLANPNDNVVAQAEWAARRLNLVVSEAALQVPFSYEANSSHSYRTLDIKKAIEQAIFWKDDEPFASRSVGWLAHLYAVDDDFENALKYHELALQLEDKPSLVASLNLNFSHIENERLEEASGELVALSGRSDANESLAQILANAGALCYARGEFEEGRKYYEQGAIAAKNRSDLATEALVRAFFARAAVKYGDPHAEAIVRASADFPHMNLSPGGTHVVRKLVSSSIRQKLERSSNSKVARSKLEWDPKTNILRLK